MMPRSTCYQHHLNGGGWQTQRTCGNEIDAEPATFVPFFLSLLFFRYKAHRVAQAFEMAHIIRLTSKSPLVLLLVRTAHL